MTYDIPFERSWWAFFKNAIFFAPVPPGGHLGSKMAAKKAKMGWKSPAFFRKLQNVTLFFKLEFIIKQYLEQALRSPFSNFTLETYFILIYIFGMKKGIFCIYWDLYNFFESLTWKSGSESLLQIFFWTFWHLKHHSSLKNDWEKCGGLQGNFGIFHFSQDAFFEK